MKNCIFVLVYFGEFNNYFPLFLKSCEFNENYNWLIITDNNKKYNYPNNCIKVEMSLTEFNELATKKIGVNINVQKPYKLCDFKPAYGLIFEDYIRDYKYWGHCDCDLIFGDLDAFLPKIFIEGYDKIFAAGHLTIYKNTLENNRLFMETYEGEELYKKVYSSEKIFVFDEYYNTERNYRKNIHSIFIDKGKKIYCKDHSLNPKINSAKFVNMIYSKKERNFIEQRYIQQRYYWEKGSIYSVDVYGEKKEYLYAHFQMRKMRCKIKNKTYIIEILPDRFVERKKIKNKITFFGKIFIGFPYMFWFDYYIRKIKAKFKRWFK